MGKISCALVVLLLALALTSCKRAVKSEERIEHYAVRGVVRGLSPDRKTIEIEHEIIPDFMPSMTMPFSVKHPKEIAHLKIGDAIAFQMSVTAKDFWIEQVKDIPRQEVHLAESAPVSPARDQSSRLREGDIMPGFTLTDEDGKQITLGTFRGRPFVLTFIFTRCPVPNFCPRMSHNFSELQSAIKNGDAGLKETRLLSITLDPDFDTPSVLKKYGAHEAADFSLWKFATGDAKEIDALTRAFSVYRQNEGGTISHGLATALVDADGKITKLWRGNGWMHEEVVREIGQNLPRKSQTTESTGALKR
jgi:protein SCO1/2